MTNKANVAFLQGVLRIIDEGRHDIFSVMYTLGINLLKRAGIEDKQHVKLALAEYAMLKVIPEFEKILLPQDEFDVLGLIYQSYMSEGEKNQKGAYYTPLKIVRNMTREFQLSKGETVFDPCCGSGAFLLSAEVCSPHQLFGSDLDRIAVMIAKINLLVKYRACEFVPQIQCLDYLESSDCSVNDDKNKFDYIVTNPPWGAMKDNDQFDSTITSDETFSCFFVKAFGQLKESGTIRFLFPEAVLNVKTHRGIRKFVLEKAGLKSVTQYRDGFTGVYTKYVDFSCGHGANTNHFMLIADKGSRAIPFSTIRQTRNLVFNFLNETDTRLISVVKNAGKYHLTNSEWGLGVVTGDNKGKLFKVCGPGLECIYTGKEVRPYTLKPAQWFVKYDRAAFQQIAREEIYRAPEKLVYKFISDRLTFSYDASGGLCLNSANILIPRVPHMSVKAVMAFLNSRLFQYLYVKMFGETKILKGNLLELPFPEISEEQNRQLSGLVDGILKGDAAKVNAVDDFVFALYALSKEDIDYVKGITDGTTDK